MMICFYYDKGGSCGLINAVQSVSSVFIIN